MKIRKNVGAKVAALIASLMTLAGGWALVHRNPPATNADATTSAAPAVATPATGTRRVAPRASTAQPQTVKRHVRTHVS